jgi:spore maturation protein CgeB
MSWKAEAQKIYEARVIKDALDRLAARFDTKNLPLSAEELQTLAKRAREAFRSEKKKDRLDRYKAHLASRYGEESVGPVSAALEEINNAIGYEEK